MEENLEEPERILQAEIDKEIEKLQYYLEESDKLIQEGDFVEIEVINKRTNAIHDKLCNLVVRAQEVKIERGIESVRAVRQWEKDAKEKYAPWIQQMEKIS